MVNLPRIGLREVEKNVWVGKLADTQLSAINEVWKKEWKYLSCAGEDRWRVLRICKKCGTVKEDVHYRRDKRICKSCVKNRRK